MNLICVVKYVPNVDNFKYDYESNRLIRENVRLNINPDDASSVALALEIKNKYKNVYVEVVTMSPKTVKPSMEDLIRLGIDKAVIISDKLFVGSDTYATSKVLGKYLKHKNYSIIFTGTHSIDGDTSHVPSQLGEILEIDQISNVVDVNLEMLSEDKIIFDVETENRITTFKMSLPGIISLSRESNFKLPYIKKSDLKKEISTQIEFISNENLNLDTYDVGFKGSLTQVKSIYNKQFKKGAQKKYKNDDEGIEAVYQFLKKNGFLA